MCDATTWYSLFLVCQAARTRCRDGASRRGRASLRSLRSLRTAVAQEVTKQATETTKQATETTKHPGCLFGLATKQAEETTKVAPKQAAQEATKQAQELAKTTVAQEANKHLGRLGGLQAEKTSRRGDQGHRRTGGDEAGARDGDGREEER